MTRSKGKMGGSTLTWFSPAKKLQLIMERQKEQQRWKSLNGPVTVTRLTPEELAARKAGKTLAEDALESPHE